MAGAEAAPSVSLHSLAHMARKCRPMLGAPAKVGSLTFIQPKAGSRQGSGFLRVSGAIAALNSRPRRKLAVSKTTFSPAASGTTSLIEACSLSAGMSPVHRFLFAHVQ